MFGVERKKKFLRSNNRTKTRGGYFLFVFLSNHPFKKKKDFVLTMGTYFERKVVIRALKVLFYGVIFHNTHVTST